jgi:hypothetical protein
MGKTYQIRRPIYQPNQEKLDLKYRGIALNINNSPIPEQEHQPVEQSPFVAKLIAQLGF